jgi:hypothetical protein
LQIFDLIRNLKFGHTTSLVIKFTSSSHGLLGRELEDGVGYVNLRATSHTRLRTRDHCTSSTLIGGKGGVGPSSLHTMLEGPTEYVNARWM